METHHRISLLRFPCSDSVNEAPMPGLNLKNWIRILVLISSWIVFSAGTCSAYAFQEPKVPNGWHSGDRKWPDWIEETTKRLEKTKSISQPGPEIEFLYSRASELLERAKSSRDNYPRFERFIAATNAMLEASDRINWSRKIEHTPQEQDYWGAGPFLSFCYFRVRQADFFASLIGEKDTEQYVTWSKAFYQQARGAFDTREYQRARLLADASSFIVFALECIAQATVQMPDTPIIK
jgi:hypothetical protein